MKRFMYLDGQVPSDIAGIMLRLAQKLVRNGELGSNNKHVEKACTSKDGKIHPNFLLVGSVVTSNSDLAEILVIADKDEDCVQPGQKGPLPVSCMRQSSVHFINGMVRYCSNAKSIITYMPNPHVGTARYLARLAAAKNIQFVNLAIVSDLNDVKKVLGISVPEDTQEVRKVEA